MQIEGLRRVAVFSGSRSGARPIYLAAATSLGEELVRRAIGLVYGGASVGLMGAVADAVMRGGGAAIGVIPASLRAREIAHLGLTELHVVDSMHERKALMSNRADGFIALPGGFGTFDELFEVLTWAQLGMHQKPIGLLDVDGYFDPLVAMVTHAVAEGFVLAEHARLLIVEREPARLVDAMTAFVPPPLGEKWIARSPRDET